MRGAALGRTHPNDNQGAGKREAQARKEQLRGAIVRRDTKECVADLDAGKGRSPERATNKTAQDESGQGGEIRLAAFHDVLPACAKQKRTRHRMCRWRVLLPEGGNELVE